jgi:predicted dienelactone hydrolase
MGERSFLFGQQGIGRIQIPVVISGGEFDFVAPVVPEQIDAFSWLNTPDKYFYLAANTSHTADLTRLITKTFHVQSDFDEGAKEGQAFFREESMALVIAFAKVYLEQNSAYEPFLRSTYIEAVSQEPFKGHLIRTVPQDPQSL